MFDQRFLGAVLKAGRKVRGLRQGQMAAELGLTSAALSHVESGRNAASPRVLETYTRALVGAERAPALRELLLSGDPDRISELASMINPENPREFLALFEDLRGGSNVQFRRNEWRQFSTLSERKVDPRFGERSLLDRKKMIEQRERAVEAIQEVIRSRGGRALIAGRESSDFGMGFPLRCDLIETTKSLVFEVRQSHRFDPRFVAEMVGKAVLLKEHGFTLVLCLMSPPMSKFDERAIEAIRTHGGRVAWMAADVESFDGIVRFGGDDPFGE